jgi:hypothetical protein
VTAGLQKLAQANSTNFMRSLTMSFVPQRVGITTTALGLQHNPVTFADFLWYDGALMTAVRRLNPKKLQIVIKKSGKRLLISIDMTYHQAGLEETPLVNTETIRMLHAKATVVDDELLGLKNRFEEIFDDEEWALHEGMCRLLSDGEGVSSISSEINSESSISNLEEAGITEIEARSIFSSDREAQLRGNLNLLLV